MPKAFSEQERKLIHRQLIEHGHRLFAAYGLRKTNVEEIARAVGISKGAFYGFYDSKEDLFIDVIEQAETRLRQEVLAVVDQAGPSPRARLFSVLSRAFEMFDELPILQFFTGGDFDLLFRRIPPETWQEHLANDVQFIEELIARCREAGIPIQVRPGTLVGLLYPLALSALSGDALNFPINLDALLELIAAYCLGEVELQYSGTPQLNLKEMVTK